MNREGFSAVKEALIVDLSRHYDDKAISVPVSAWTELGKFVGPLRSRYSMMIGADCCRLHMPSFQNQTIKLNL